MDYSRPVTEIIRARTSRRTYSSKKISPTDRDSFQSFIDANCEAPFGTNIRFGLFTADDGDSDALKGLGTYGFIRNPYGFIIGAAFDSPKSMEDFGFIMEKIVLKATEMGLGTCWLGGTFSRSKFADKINLAPTESLLAVAAIGYPAKKEGKFERLIQWSVKARKRLPWDRLFFDDSFSKPLSEEEAGQFKVPLEMVRIGPSASNKQPWRIVKANDSLFHLYLQRTEGYQRQLDFVKAPDLQRVDMGIAMNHFEETCREERIEGEWIIAQPTSCGALPERTEYVASFRVG